MIIVFKYVLGQRTRAMTIWPFIILKDKVLRDDEVLINHEKIHLKQQLEMLILPFYLWYFIEYLIRLFKYDRFNAYKNISFESESYSNQEDMSYLKNRKMFSWVKYLKRQ